MSWKSRERREFLEGSVGLCQTLLNGEETKTLLWGDSDKCRLSEAVGTPDGSGLKGEWEEKIWKQGAWAVFSRSFTIREGKEIG